MFTSDHQKKGSTSNGHYQCSDNINPDIIQPWFLTLVGHSSQIVFQKGGNHQVSDETTTKKQGALRFLMEIDVAIPESAYSIEV